MSTGLHFITPHLVRGPDGPWTGLAHDLSSRGVAIVYGAVRPWVDALPHGRELSRIVGRDRGRMDALARNDARNEFGAVRYFVKCASAIALSCDPGQVDLAYTVQGRMQVRGQARLQLNLSHTDGVAVLALTDSAPIGVDVEFSDRASVPDPMDASVTTRGERATLAAVVDPGERRIRALTLWTLKEAYTKALGQGMMFPFAELDFGFDGSSWSLGRSIQASARTGSPGDRATVRTWELDDPSGAGRGRCVVSAVTLASPTAAPLFENATRLEPTVVSMARSVRAGAAPR